LKDKSYNIEKLLFYVIIISVIIFYNSNFEKKNIMINEINGYTFLQNSYAIEKKSDSEQKIKDKKISLNSNFISENNTNTTTQTKEANINFVAVGDCDCNQYAKDKVNNIIVIYKKS
jgi:hypothetical protein